MPETAHLLDLNLSRLHNSEKGEADEQIQEAIACNMALSIGPHVTVIDERLYLPKESTDDKQRCKDAGVPDDIEFKTKSQLALEMIRSSRAKRVRFAWVGVD